MAMSPKQLLRRCDIRDRVEADFAPGGEVYEEFRRQVVRLGPAEVARMLGCSRQTPHNLIDGRTALSPKWVRLLAESLLAEDDTKKGGE